MEKIDNQNDIRSEEILVLAKALPLPGATHGETVCCAGVTRDGHWRRQYPIPFRRLTKKFKRWQWIEYKYKTPDKDKRTESRKVQENSIITKGLLKEDERAIFLNKIVISSTKRAQENGQSLALVRPENIKLNIIRKPDEDIEKESLRYNEVARQRGLFDANDGKDLKAITPCPYKFQFSWQDSEGNNHRNTSEDWEISAMYYNLTKNYNEEYALKEIQDTFANKYPKKGMVFAMGTHSRWADKWLLIGVIRLDRLVQEALF